MLVMPVGMPVMQRCCISMLLALQISASAWSDDCHIAGGTCAFKDAVPVTGEAFLQHSAKREQVRQGPFPVHRHLQASAESMIQTTFGGNLGGDGLPADAKKLFNEKLCKVKSDDVVEDAVGDNKSKLAAKKASPQLQATAEDKVAQPDNDDGYDSASDFDGPEPKDLLKDADGDNKVKPAPQKASPQLQAATAEDKMGQPDNDLAVDFGGPEPDDLLEGADGDKKAQKSGLGRLMDASNKGHENEADSEFNTETEDDLQEDKQKDDAKDNYKDSDDGMGEDQDTDKDKDKDEKNENDNGNAGNHKARRPQKTSSEAHKKFQSGSLLQAAPSRDSKSGTQPKQHPSTFGKLLDDDEVSEFSSQVAPLNQKGLQQVLALKSESEMAMFIHRVAESCSLKVIDEGGLNGEVGSWMRGDLMPVDVSFDRLKVGMFKALLAASEAHWVSVKKTALEGITAENAPLDLLGYVQVRALRNKKQMIHFVRRMVIDMGVKITDPKGFEGLMVYYSEPDDSQSFSRLITEIKKAAMERQWAELE